MARSTLLILMIIFLHFPSMAKAADEAETRQGEFLARIVPEIERAKARSGSEEIRNFPTKLAVAHAALESSYGTSRQARKLCNWYGLMDSHGRPLRFETCGESAERYLRTLEEHRAYRRLRSKLREGANTDELIGTMGAYSTNPNYASILRRVIRSPAMRHLWDTCPPEETGGLSKGLAKGKKSCTLTHKILTYLIIMGYAH